MLKQPAAVQAGFGMTVGGKQNCFAMINYLKSTPLFEKYTI